MASKNLRLGINALILSLRTLVFIALSLLVVRMLLSSLGELQYGIYTLVSSIVVSVSFFTGSLSVSCQRFFTYELGKVEDGQIQLIFGLSLSVFLKWSIIIVLIAETIGLWFLNSQLNIPHQIMPSANFVYQASIVTFVIFFLTIPYSALIVAHEKLKAYAFLSIIEVVIKLVASGLLFLVPQHKMEVYSILIMALTSLIFCLNIIYCKTRLGINVFYLYRNKDRRRDFVNFSGWNIIGSLTAISFDQGLNFMLNVFFGPFINASRAVAMQINNGMAQLYTNFYTAVRPEMTKSYASGNRDYVVLILINASKYGIFILAFFFMPVLLETRYLLSLWLPSIPAFTLQFVRLTIVFGFLNALQVPISAVVQAEGNIKRYQIVIGAIMLLCLPASYVLLSFGLPPTYTYWVMIILSCVALYFRIHILSAIAPISFLFYFKEVLLRVVLVSGIVYGICSAVLILFEESLWRFMLITLLSSSLLLILVYCIGLKPFERKKVVFLIRNTKIFKTDA